MSTARSASWQLDFGIENGVYPGFAASTEELATEGLYSHGLRQAFELLELDGVFCSEQTPLVYFKEVDAIGPDQALRLHRRFWNHGTAPILVVVTPDQVHVYSGMARPQPVEESAGRAALPGRHAGAGGRRVAALPDCGGERSVLSRSRSGRSTLTAALTGICSPV